MTHKAIIGPLQGSLAGVIDKNIGASGRQDRSDRCANYTNPDDLDMDANVPLIVDLDGTLLRSDLLIEAAFRRLGDNPTAIFGMLRALKSGKAALKHFLCDNTDCSPATLPYDETVLNILHRARKAGRKIYLASASHETFVSAISAHLGIFDGHFATTLSVNLSGRNKAQCLIDNFGSGNFDYIGNDTADLPVWKVARLPIAIRTPRAVAAKLRTMAPDAVFLDHKRTTLKSWRKQLRVHQYAKNALVFLPMFAAHMFDLASLFTATLAALAFCFAASACYILNDLVDLREDRGHRSKKDRPLARGDIPVIHAVMAVPILLGLATIVSLSISLAFAGTLAIYFVLTTFYTLHLKRILLVDVLTLAGLYTIRMLGGAIALDIDLSSWLVVFSLSIFVSLALMKRFVELAALVDSKKPSPSNRGYENADLTMLAALSAAAGFNAVTVLALYVSGFSVSTLYTRPDLLLFACPILTYWIGRALILAQRRQMQDDPIVFAIKDPMSRASGLAMLGVFVAASW
ncbi:UbiA family prenyltransferase [Octadecabacter sp. G9-8]|uniref:UbiA family prenyltransferase n=1 Tax=Octadecabacter dasysiphoniae TaxID=2909341 RepID=A0ABS9CWA0_9RHOB|nr:UbiA family prenyltransferase [Octadecabacter dasysiphoniae]MCF2870436.1 UbiA family prenyltransferase [Octadecabacter dasysiphoniae]